MPAIANPSANRKPRVFISYAREDGEQIAATLRVRLEAEEQIPIWQDRVSLLGGHDWWVQILEALEVVDFMVVVITPRALQSKYVRAEWREARKRGVCVFPVRTELSINRNGLPRWIANAHTYDMRLSEGWSTFVGHLRNECKEPRVPFMVEDLPDNFVPRPKEFDALLKHLLTPDREDPVAITAALRGAGGYGKTTLARALCHNDDIQNAFQHGVLWVTLGQNPGDLTSKVVDLIRALSNEPITFSGPDAAVARLREWLADRDILMVIDDVWDRAHLKPFLQGGSRCARLITTRNLDTLPEKANKIPVDQMHTQEAFDLLSAGLPDQRQQTQRAVEALAHRLGEWPLMLTIVNGQLRNRVSDLHQPFPDALKFVDDALTERGLTAFDVRNTADREQAVGITLGLSIEMLSETERLRFAELAIFAEDIDIPIATLELYWGKTGGLSKLAVDQLCQRLFNLSLLLALDLQRRAIRLHDVVRHYLMDRHQSAVAQWHSQLLAGYNAEGKAWADVEDDGYLYAYLAHHLLGAQCPDELIATCKDPRYLARKAHAHKAWMVEQDLWVAQHEARDDSELRQLARAFSQAAHLLNAVQNLADLSATLASRLAHRVPELAQRLIASMQPSYLTATHPLPDMPHPALVRTLVGHKGAVVACAVSPDDKWIVSASSDCTLKVWDARNGEEKLSLLHTGRLTDCAVSPDGKWIVSASHDTVWVWDAATGREEFRLPDNSYSIRHCSMSGDGRWIVSGADTTLTVWDTQNGLQKSTLQGHTDTIADLAASPDAAWVVSASCDGTLKVWDLVTGCKKFTLLGHSSYVNGCAVSADGRWIASASADGTLRVWDAVSGRQKFNLATPKILFCCAVSPDGRWIVSPKLNGMRWDTLTLWDVPSGAHKLSLTGHKESVKDCAISADGSWVVSASLDQTLKVWDVATRPETYTAVDASREVTACAVSPDGKWFVSVANGTLKVWDATTGAERNRMVGTSSRVRACAVSPDGRWIISGESDTLLRVWDTVSGVQKLLFAAGGAVEGCAVSSDGKWVVSSVGGSLKVWDPATGDSKFTFADGKSHGACAVSPDSRWIVSAKGDTLRMWDAASGAEKFTLRGHTDNVADCSVSPDGQWIVSASRDGTLKVWDAGTGAEKFTLTGHADFVTGCAMSGDGKWIVSASRDQTLKVWDATLGRCIGTLRVDGSLSCCAWHPDGERIIAGGEHGVYWLRFVNA